MAKKEAPTKKAGGAKNAARMTMIQTEAKKLWATGKYKKYHECVSQACVDLKAAGKM